MHFVRDGKLKQRKPRRVTAALLIFMTAGYTTLIADPAETNGVLRSRAYKFAHIKSQQAQELLSQLKIGTAYDALSDEVLIVTSDKGVDLIKATGVITILDQPKPVQMRVLMAADGQPLPDLKVLITGMKTISAGTMTDAPSKSSNNPAIIDIVDNRLIAIASEELLPEIEKAVEEWKKKNAPPQPAEQVIPKVPAEAERPAVPPATVESETPAKPLQEVAAPLLDEPNEPNEMSIPEPAVETPAAQAVTVSAEENLTDMLKTEPNTTEEFIGDELLKALLDEEKKAQQPPPPQAAEPNLPAITAPPPPQSTEPIKETTQPATEQEDTFQKIVEKLEKSSQPPQLEQAKTVEESRREAVSESLRLQREYALLRQQLAKEKGEPLPGPVEPQEEKVKETPTESEDRAKTQIPKQAADEELETTMDLPQEVMLESLVDLVGKQLGLNYMYDPAALKDQKVYLKLNKGKVKVKDLYALMESVLRFRGFVMTRRDDLITIVKGEELAKVDTALVKPGEQIQAGDIIVSGIFQLKHLSTDAAQKILTDMKLGLAEGFQAVPETGTLIVTDYAYRMDRIRDVLNIVDVPGGKKLRYRQLKFIQAADLVTKLEALVAQMEGVSMQVSAPAAAPQTRTVTTRNPQTGKTETKQVPVETAGPAGKPATKDTVYIDTDERTNRILMIGSPAQIDIINQLIDTLDVAQFGLKYVREYIIQYVEAMEVVNVLNELGLANVTVSGTAPATTAKPSRTTTARTPPAGAAQPGQPAPATPPVSQAAASAAAADNQPNVSIRPATNSLLVNATAEQHNAIELVIAHVDVVQKDQRTIREYEIQYVDTQEIIDTMTELGMISEQNVRGASSSYYDDRSRGGRTSRTAQQQQQQIAQETASAAPMLAGFGEEGAEGDVTAQEPQIAVLEATNSLLVFATPRQHNAISLLIAHADRTPETTTTPYVVYALENQDPVELADVLTKLIQETVEEVGKTSTPESKIQTGQPTTGTGAGAPPTLEEQKIRVIPDPMSYSLIVYANKRNQQWISELVTALDEYRPQVLLDCTLVVINKDESFKYDMDIISKTYHELTLKSPSPVSTISGNFSEQRYGEARSTSGTFTGFFNSDMVQALLEAVQTKSYGRVMARPKILVNDNQEGEIKTENTTSIAQQKSIVQPGSETGQTITTTDVSFSEYASGVTLKIKPHISKGDMLRLEITLGRADFELKDDVTVAGNTYPRPPDILSTDVTTVATVPDGTTIILGGLEGVDQQKNITKVPILGDLPIVGGLFRGINDIGDQSKLYVFVKAHVLRPSDQVEGLEDIRRVSGKNREAFEDMEKKFQEHQDWPGVKPKPMDPVTVLEEDE